MKVEQIEWRLEPLKIGDILGTLSLIVLLLVVGCYLGFYSMIPSPVKCEPIWKLEYVIICISSVQRTIGPTITLKKNTTIHEWTQLSDYLSQPVEDLNSTWYHLCLTFLTKHPACESHPTHLTSSLACEQKMIHQAFNFSTWIRIFRAFSTQRSFVEKSHSDSTTQTI